MAFCIHCGKQLPEGVAFCINCGAPLDQASGAAAGAASGLAAQPTAAQPTTPAATQTQPAVAPVAQPAAAVPASRSGRPKALPIALGLAGVLVGGVAAAGFATDWFGLAGSGAGQAASATAASSSNAAAPDQSVSSNAAASSAPDGASLPDAAAQAGSNRQKTYYLAASDGNVAVYASDQAVPYRITDLAVAELDGSMQAKLDERISFASADDAIAQVDEWSKAIKEALPKGAIPPTFTKAEASSISATDDLDPYDPYQAIDGNVRSGWCTNPVTAGDGTGQWIELSNDSLQRVSGIRILSGYCKDADMYAKQRRPHDITITFSDGTTQHASLQDVFGEYQDIPLESPIDTTMMRITIDSTYAPTYAGQCYDDCAISEIEVY